MMMMMTMMMSVYLFVCLSVRPSEHSAWNSSAPTRQNFMKIYV